MDPDAVPHHEPRLARAVALAYDLPQPPASKQLQHISQNWRPYRTWVTLLLRTYLEDHTRRSAASRTCPGKPWGLDGTEQGLPRGRGPSRDVCPFSGLAVC